MSESNKYESLKNEYAATVYVIQEIPGTRDGNPKINKKNNDLFQNFLKKISKIEKIHVSNTIMENILLDNNVPKSKIHK